MGRITLSGRATPIVVWEPAPHMDRATRVEADPSCGVSSRPAIEKRLHDIEAIAAKHDNDAALSAFACRLREAGSGRSHSNLGEK